MKNNYKVEEFRGTDNLFIAEVLNDDNEADGGYITGAVYKLAPTSNISKTVETSSETKYYDNAPAFTINAEGADTITLDVPAVPLDTLAYITGKEIDDATGAMMDGEAVQRYFALGYRLGLTDGSYRYVWRYKGSFGVPDETSATKDNQTNSNNQQLTYTGVMTQHIFTKPAKPQRALVVDERDGKADLSAFFDTVTTIDTLEAKATTTHTITNNLTNCTNSNTATSVNAGSAYSATITAETDHTLGTVTVTMGGTDISATAVNGGVVTIANVTGNVVITATATAD